MSILQINCLHVINGYRMLCLSDESAIANHQLSKVVMETVFPMPVCLWHMSFQLGIKLVLDTAIFSDTIL